jgi:hypothetical protein
MTCCQFKQAILRFEARTIDIFYEEGQISGCSVMIIIIRYVALFRRLALKQLQLGRSLTRHQTLR